MTRLFVELPIFRSRWKDMGLNDDDLKRLQEELLADPKSVRLCVELAACGKCGLLSSNGAKAAVFV